MPKYVTLKTRTEQITFGRDESEEDLGLQVALSLDSMMSITRVQKKTTEDTIELHRQTYEPDFSENTPLFFPLVLSILSHPTCKTHRRINEISRKFQECVIV